jgi:hypothetical protein
MLLPFLGGRGIVGISRLTHRNHAVHSCCRLPRSGPRLDSIQMIEASV